MENIGGCSHLAPIPNGPPRRLIDVIQRLLTGKALRDRSLRHGANGDQTRQLRAHPRSWTGELPTTRLRNLRRHSGATHPLLVVEALDHRTRPVTAAFS